MIVKKRQGTLDYLEVRNRKATARIALQGAHIFHFETQEKGVLLWLSKTALFEKSKAIRGGIPICWPWFGVNQDDETLPKHGFARNSVWEHTATTEDDENETQISLVLKSSPETLALWPFAFELMLDIRIGATLTLELTTRNRDAKAFTITQALHTYFRISDIEKVSVEGLGQTLRFDQEHDVIYENVSNVFRLHDTKKVVSINSSGSKSVVIWNPWEKVAATMPDLDDFTTMLCIETANVGSDKRILQPNEQHTLGVVLKQE